jgi:oxygen-independent coproporphyrinogen-3 oxidase
MVETSIYLHIPFCSRRCGYCDFNTYAGLEYLIPTYVDALCQEIEIVAKNLKETNPIHTIFFGGGTPSIIPLDDLKRVMTTIEKNFYIEPDAELTLEANPGSLSLKYLNGLKDIGFNRMSIGMQSAHPDDLKVLDRMHNFPTVKQSVTWCKQAGFQHINLDVIFGIPGQTIERWQETLDLALETEIDHLSLYSLSIEEGTPLDQKIKKGLLPSPDDDLAAAMYEYAIVELEVKGFQQYEISNWAQGEQTRCQHNLQYWRYLPYVGFGAGAHSFINRQRIENKSKVMDYIEGIQNSNMADALLFPAATYIEELTKWDQMQEYLMVGFRLTEEGISAIEFKRIFGIGLEIVFGLQIRNLKEQGLIEPHPKLVDRLRLTSKGRLFGNRVFEQFVGNTPPVQTNYDQ